MPPPRAPDGAAPNNPTPSTTADSAPPVALADPAPPPPPAAEVAPSAAKAGLLATYSRTLVDRLDRHKVYPPLSQRRGEEATITVRLTLSEDGQLIGVVPLGNGPGRLVEASLAAVQAAAPFPPLPAALGMRQAVFTLPIVYRLQ